MFPDIEALTPDTRGLVALGGDLAPRTLLEAYRKGLFPWEGTPPIPWFSPDPRLILEPDVFHASKSLQKKRGSGHYRFTIDHCFRSVMTRCATTIRRGQRGTWITQSMIGAYCELHHRGQAHSVEVWRGDHLVGGLYGLALGRAFFGESMFHSEADTSKLALMFLCEHLSSRDFDFIDCQQDTPHMRRLGAHALSRAAYLIRLKQAIETTEHWLDGPAAASSNSSQPRPSRTNGRIANCLPATLPHPTRS